MSQHKPRVGGSTFGFFYHADLRRSLASLAEAGFRDVELAAGEPHLRPPTTTSEDCRVIRRSLDELGMNCVSINPIEMNLISPNAEIRELCRRNYVASARILAEVGGEVLVVVPGRYNGLIPMPESQAMDLFQAQLSVLLDEVRRLDLTLALETTPFGFLGSTEALVKTIEQVGDPRLGLALDVANTFPREDIAASVRAGGKHLRMVQFSGTWRDRWAHASISEGDLDVDQLRQALVEIEYAGPVIYELVDGKDPAPRLAPDLTALEQAGWSR